MSTLRTLLFSTLYPSSARPNHGIFVETRLRELLKSGRVETKVVAPVPWFPSTAARFGDWAKLARTPRHETRNGVECWHPRYVLPPKVGMNVAPYTLAMGARATVARLIQDGFDFDVIDAHYYYPDGVAAGMLARWFKKPFVVTARGTDLNLISRYALPRRMIVSTTQRAACSIGVSAALTGVMRELGAEPDRVQVIRNGVDLERFHPVDRSGARAALQLPERPVLLSVGNLLESKGHHLAMKALLELPDANLVIAGQGKEEDNLRRLAAELGVTDRVRFAGLVPNTELANYYSAADVLVLASSREGWPNVLLESMACGTPVVATTTGGIPEVVREPVAGRLVKDRSAAAFASAIKELLSAPIDRAAVRRYAEGFSWHATTQAQIDLFDAIAARHKKGVVRA